MAIIGSAYVEIHALDKFLQRDIDNAMKKIKDPSLNFSADVDLKPVRAKIKALRNEVKSSALKFNIDANYQEVIDTLDVIKAEQEKDPLVLDVQSDTRELEKTIERLKAQIGDRTSTINADADTGAAETQLDFAARRRTAPIALKLDPASAKAFQGLMYTLIGAVPADKIKAVLQGVAGNFEMLAVSGAKLGTIIGSIGATALTAGANIFTIADDIAAVIGIAAVAPAAFSGMAAGIFANTLAWKGFSEAVTGKGKKALEAMAKLPVEAQRAAKAMKGLGTQISQPVQKAFWVAMNGELERTAKVLVPQLAEGLSGTSAVMGKMTSSILSSFRQLAESGGLKTLFTNINKGWDNAAKGAKPLFDALNTLSVTGSKYLVPFGKSLGDLGTRFNNFIDSANKTGKIDQWITEATNSFENLGSVVKSTVGIFKGLSDAAARSGSSSLEDFAIGIRNVSDAVNSEPFKSRLVAVLEGARSGSDALGEGFKKLTGLIGKSTGAISEFLETAGQISGQLLTNITKMFDGTGLGTGLLTALWGFQDAMTALEPGFSDLGTILGDLGEIAGTVFTSMAPGLNNLLSTLEGVVAGIKDGVIAAMPIFNEFTQNIFSVISGPIVTLAQGIGNLLSLFAKLPGPIQTVLTSLALLVAFRGRITTLFGTIGGAFANMRSGIEGNATGLSNSMKNMYGHFKNAGTNIGSAANAMRLIPFAATTSGMGGVAAAAGSAAASIGKAAGSGLRGALSGGAALLGGPWGIALAGGIALISAFGQAQADSDAKVKSLSQSLDQQSGRVTNSTKSLLATNALDGATNAWDDFFRGVIQGSASTEETLKDLGISTKEYTDRLADPSGRDAFTKGLEEIGMALKLGKPITEEMAAAIGTTKEELKGVSGQSMVHLANKAADAAGELKKAEDKVKAVAEATGTNSVQAAILSRNYETLASATSSASEKFSALKQNLDVISGGTQSFTESQKNVAQSLDDTKNRLKEIATDAGGSLKSLYSVKDGFNFASQAGRDLHTSLSGTADSILQIGTAALDQAIKGGKNATDANAIAIGAMQPAIASLRQQLKDTGLLPAQIDSIVRSFGLMPDQVSAAISVDGAEEAQRKIIMTKLAADSFSTGNYTGVLAALPDAAKKAIADATGTAEAFKNGDWETVLKALDQTGPGKEAALAQILSVTNGNYEAALKALDLTGGPVDDAKAQALGYKNGDYTAELEALNKNFGPVANAKAQALGYKNADYTAELEALNKNLGPVANAKAQALGYKNSDYTAALEARNIAGGVISGAIGAGRNYADGSYLASLRAQADYGSINAASGALNAAAYTRTAVIRLVADASSVQSANDYIAVAGKGRYANGGITNGLGAQVFANGGLMSGIRANLSKFANGSENHVAQIAKGAWPVRMWAEPETGGEAYIPLGKNKRKRSLEILRKVMAEFGLGAFAKFADGGIMPKYNMTSVASTASAVRTPAYTPMTSGTAAYTNPIIINIYPKQGMDEVEVGKAAVREINWQMQSR